MADTEYRRPTTVAAVMCELARVIKQLSEKPEALKKARTRFAKELGDDPNRKAQV